MLVKDFSFELPEQLIADKPVTPRDASRMLVVEDSSFVDAQTKNLPSYVTSKDLIIFNDTQVIPAFLEGTIGESKVSVNLHKNLSTNSWKAFAYPARKFKIDTIFSINENFFARVVARDGGEVTLEFNVAGDALVTAIELFGRTPLPPYIQKDNDRKEADKCDYQTIYAKHKGAVAAPTAGLHFTESLFLQLEKKQVDYAFVTLHVGAGTFLPVKAEDTNDHVMHSEYCILAPEVAQRINETKKQGGRVIAIGTTSMRVLESAATENGVVEPLAGETDIFITPGFQFKIVDMLLTNFHLPQSTLFMLVCSFSGFKRMQSAYAHAIAKQYRFYSYGDACLLSKF